MPRLWCAMARFEASRRVRVGHEGGPEQVDGGREEVYLRPGHNLLHQAVDGASVEAGGRTA